MWLVFNYVVSMVSKMCRQPVTAAVPLVCRLDCPLRLSVRLSDKRSREGPP